MTFILKNKEVMKLTFKPQEGFYQEALLNVMLVFITLGIFLPWGVTNIRRLVWGNISLNGKRFSYLGQPKEIITGYLVLLIFYFIAKMFSLLAQQFEGVYIELILTFLTAVIFFTLLFKAQLGSFKYQAQRTSYQGIRFHTKLPDYKGQYVLCLKMGSMTAMTFGLLYGYYYFKLEKLKYSSLSYGQENFKLELSFREYARVYFQHIPIALGLLYLWQYYLPTFQDNSSMVFLTSAFGLILLLILFLHLVFSLFHLKIRSLKTENLSFSSDLDFQSYIFSNFMNLPILIFTLGLALPIVIARNIGLFAGSVTVNGGSFLETVDLRKNQDGFDEILSQSFDLDMLDVF